MRTIHKNIIERLNNWACECTLLQTKPIRSWTCYVASAIAAITFLWSVGCKKSQETDGLVYKPDKAVVYFRASTPKDTIDIIISSGNFKTVSHYANPSYQCYTIQMPSSMTYEEASKYLDRFSPAVLIEPLCSGTDVYLWGRKICVPRPDSNGNCPDGFIKGSTSSGPFLKDRIPACIPEDMLP